jgi:hypothetical protein
LLKDEQIGTQSENFVGLFMASPLHPHVNLQNNSANLTHFGALPDSIHQEIPTLNEKRNHQFP